MDAFWPGPLTLILARAAHRGYRQRQAGQHRPALSLASRGPGLAGGFAAGKPNGQGGVAAPSANKFGQVSPTLAEHVRAEFPDEVTAGMPVLEGGASEVGIESTILDLSRLDQGAGPVLLRPGHVSAAQIEAVLGAQVFAPDAPRRAPRARSRRITRRAPSWNWPATRAWPTSCKASACPRARWRWCRSTPRRPRPMPACNGARCRPIRRATRRRCTRCCASWTPRAMPASSQAPPANDAWHAVNDRIGRAAAAFTLDTSDL